MMKVYAEPTGGGARGVRTGGTRRRTAETAARPRSTRGTARTAGR